MPSEPGSGRQPGDGGESGGGLRVCALGDVAVGSATRVDLDGLRLAVVRTGAEDVHVIGDRCSHADYSLAEGEVDVADCTIECWRHGAVFSLRNGEPETLPATQPVPVYPAKIHNDEVWIDVPGTPAEPGTVSKQTDAAHDGGAR